LPTYRHCRNVDTNGLTGDLKTSVERQWDAGGETWSGGDTTYFRYYLGAAGNMISAPKTGDETTRIHYVFDAWNRLAAVYADDSQNPGQPGDLIAAYEYDGANRRVEKTLADETAVDYFYNRQWQMLEQRTNDGETTVVDQYVWSPRYIDAPIVRFHDANGDGDLLDAGDNTRCFTGDANYNVTATIDASTGSIIARYVYTAYGEATAYDSNWSNGAAPADDGPLYCGYMFDAETANFLARNRYYNSSLATWISRDPIGYWSGEMNLYRYCLNNPVRYIDPDGLATWDASAGPYSGGAGLLGGYMNKGDTVINTAVGGITVMSGNLEKSGDKDFNAAKCALKALGFDLPKTENGIYWGKPSP